VIGGLHTQESTVFPLITASERCGDFSQAGVDEIARRLDDV
jgi:hypothetical protein